MRVEHEVLIQIPFHSPPIKYQSHKGCLYVERFLTTSMHYPCHVGEIIHPLNVQDGLTAMIITPLPLQRDCRLHARAIGVLALQTGTDDCSKILMVPSDKLTDNYQHVANYSDIHPLFLDQIKHFFTHYEAEDDKNAPVFAEWLGVEEAIKRIQARISDQKKIA